MIDFEAQAERDKALEAVSTVLERLPQDTKEGLSSKIRAVHIILAIVALGKRFALDNQLCGKNSKNPLEGERFVDSQARTPGHSSILEKVFATYVWHF